jgi:hypothetical protein
MTIKDKIISIGRFKKVLTKPYKVPNIKKYMLFLEGINMEEMICTECGTITTMNIPCCPEPHIVKTNSKHGKDAEMLHRLIDENGMQKAALKKLYEKAIYGNISTLDVHWIKDHIKYER